MKIHVIENFCKSVTLLLALKLTISVIGTGGMVGIKLEQGGRWKDFAKLIR